MKLALSFSLSSLSVNCSQLNPVTTNFSIPFSLFLTPRLYLKDFTFKEYLCYILDVAPPGFSTTSHAVAQRRP